MKKSLGIIFLCLLFYSSTYSDEKIYGPSDQFVKNYFSKMTVADIIVLASPNALTHITSNSEGVQYHFIISMKKVTDPVPVICFVNIKLSTCRVP
tara:strand:+ start:405 stop:689 length:285 start_codon:yes stop_codon:yes gene_type:complete